MANADISKNDLGFIELNLKFFNFRRSLKRADNLAGKKILGLEENVKIFTF